MPVIVSVIMPVDRPGVDAERSIASVLAQTFSSFELIIVSAEPLLLPADDRIRQVIVAARNPALRRNRAAESARGEILAFIDDDAFAHREWLARGVSHFERDASIVAVGGPDPAPDDSSVAELISDSLLAAPLIGSGVACHESRPAAFDVSAPHDIALVNLFVRAEVFRGLGGFDESIGYVGEDSALLERAMGKGRVRYEPEVIVYHRRRRFPLAYLKQRWRYRVKTGKMLVRGKGHYRGATKIYAFLAAGTIAIVLAVVMPMTIPLLLAGYAAIVYALGWRSSRLPVPMRLLLPLFFLTHHGCYFFGIVGGALAGIVGTAEE